MHVSGVHHPARIQGCVPNKSSCLEFAHLVLYGRSAMDSIGPSFRNVTNNSFGDNVTIYQGNIQNPVADQTDQCLKDLRLTDPRDDKTRIQQTKGGLLKESSNWIFQNETFKQWRDDE